MTSSIILAWVLVGMAPVNWWAFVIHLRVLLRNRDVYALYMQLGFFGLLALATTSLAVVAANYLLDMPLPRGVSFALLAATTLLISTPALVFITDYYRRR